MAESLAIQFCDEALDLLELTEYRFKQGRTDEPTLEAAQRLYAEAERACPACGTYAPLARPAVL